jgi:hypothetical protein
VSLANKSAIHSSDTRAHPSHPQPIDPAPVRGRRAHSPFGHGVLRSRIGERDGRHRRRRTAHLPRRMQRRRRQRVELVLCRSQLLLHLQRQNLLQLRQLDTLLELLSRDLALQDRGGCVGATRCIVGRIATFEASRHRRQMPHPGVHALVRASHLITNIERRVKQGDLSSVDAKALLQELSALLARMGVGRSDPSCEGAKAEAT